MKGRDPTGKPLLAMGFSFLREIAARHASRYNRDQSKSSERNNRQSLLMASIRAHFWLRRLGAMAGIGLFVYLGILLVFSLLENSLLYFPSRYPEGDWSLEPGMEDAWFSSDDGTKLHGWFMEVQQPRAVVLFSHGNGGSIAWRRELIDAFRDLRVSALLWSYRGYGRSEGTPHEAGILRDARAARAWLSTRAGVKQHDVVLWGESLGGGVSVDLAQDGARALILENTFTSIPDVAAFHYPWLPARMLMKNRYDSLAKIPHYHGPLLQFHGDADTIVPYEMGRRLFAAANEPKKFVTLAGADHNDPRTNTIQRELDRFFEQLASLPQSPSAL